MAILQGASFAVIEEESYCVACDDYLVCSGVPCAEHPIVCSFKSDPMLMEFECALRNGSPWGDIVCAEEEMRLNARTPDQVEKDLQKLVKERRDEIDGLRKYVVEKSIRHHCEMVDGKHVLKHKMRKSCENLSLPGERLPDGSMYEGGCWAHLVGACPFMHPGEEAIYTFTDNRPLKLQKGKQEKTFDTKQVQWLSNKEPVRPIPKAAPDNKWSAPMLDPW